MHLLAIVDATDVQAPDGPATLVAGLSLLERTARLADVCGADEIAVVLPDAFPTPGRPFDDANLDAPVQFMSPGATTAPLTPPDAVAILDAGAVYDRGFVDGLFDRLADLEPGQTRGTACRHLALRRSDGSTTPEAILEQPAAVRRDAAPELELDESDWTLTIDSDRAVGRAADRLFEGCRKEADGIIARHLNRHVSLAISRRLAPTGVRPDHVTFVTFALGIAATIAAVFGGYLGFLAAGILYQINSIVDGVDGELARVRYEFSVTGEWLDTISDDLADLLMCAGIGIGAWRTVVDAPGPLGADTWLILGAVAAVAKLTVMIVYYRFLIAEGRGDVQAFEWDFDDDDDGDDSDDATDESTLQWMLSGLYYLFRKDFIVFAAMVLSVVGLLPWVLFGLAPGYAIVAVSLLVQQARHRAASRT